MLSLIIGYWLTKYSYLLIIALIIGSTSLLIPKLMESIHWLWMKISLTIGFAWSRILLTVIFVIVLIPLSFLSGIFSKRTIQIKPSKLTYFKVRNHIYTKDDLENVW